mmetsp:Transcript_16135/g.32656  ORF Transcript_16135/g.32656 Transcript_16135/m.32656 type:complete len:325 (-) Transcript_16135:684-1658(-)
MKSLRWVTTLVVPPNQDGVRLDRFIRRSFPHLAQARLEKLIRKGEVRVTPVDGQAGLVVLSGGGTRLRADQSVMFDSSALGDQIPPRLRLPISPDVTQAKVLHRTILFEDERVMVINKPAGVAVQGGSGIRHGSTVDACFPHCKLVHRLDREVGGVLLLAKDLEAAQELTEMFRLRRIRKLYLGVHVGRIAVDSVELNAPVGGRPASTRVSVTHRTQGQLEGLLFATELEPISGRKHQLRVHSSDALQSPLLGDRRYGRPIRKHPEWSKFQGIAPLFGDSLHLFARELVFPSLGRRCETEVTRVRAPLSGCMKRLWEAMGWPIA